MKFLYASSLFAALATAGTSLPASEPDFYNYAGRCTAMTQLPEPGGPHQVGTSTFHFTDASRPEQGSADPNDRRQVIFQLWYPAIRAADGDPVAYVPELDQIRAAFSADPRDVPQKLAKGLAPYACIATEAYADAPVSDLAKRYPVIVLSPGGGVSRHWHTAQAQEFASRGYVVVVLSHAYSGLDLFPGLPVLSVERWLAPRAATPEQRTALDEAMSDELALDARFGLTQVENIASGAISHPLNGRIDLSRVAIAGHSRGGKTVARACSSDSRFKACVTYDNLAPERERATGLRTPQLTVRTAWEPDRRDTLHAYMKLNPGAAVDVEIAQATHFTFTDLQIVDPQQYPAKLDPVRGLSLANGITLDFLDSVWAGKAPTLSGFAKPGEVTVWTNHDS